MCVFLTNDVAIFWTDSGGQGLVAGAQILSGEVKDRSFAILQRECVIYYSVCVLTDMTCAYVNMNVVFCFVSVDQRGVRGS